ncbi:hypothetical protein CW304_13740 [Bacillus sp. UFRGS-B20]|nr:hypothetical protein CW304_13740 [Bacillus sp. UFRGS-B20]
MITPICQPSPYIVQSRAGRRYRFLSLVLNFFVAFVHFFINSRIFVSDWKLGVSNANAWILF